MSLNQEELSHDIGVDRTDIKIVAFEKTSDIVTLKAILINEFTEKRKVFCFFYQKFEKNCEKLLCDNLFSLLPRASQSN